MMRFVLACVMLPVLALEAQVPRFRFALTEPDLRSDVRRSVDSMIAVDDGVHGCPPRADTLWAADARAPIPLVWLQASLRPECWQAGLTGVVQRRLRVDPAALEFYDQVVRARNSADEGERVLALTFLIRSRDPRYISLLRQVAREQKPDVLPSGDYNAAYYAIIALAPYLQTPFDARTIVERAAADPHSEVARQAGVLALAAANDSVSRITLVRALPLASVGEHVRRAVTRALAHAPCSPGMIFVELHGVEGQDFSTCELPPRIR